MSWYIGTRDQCDAYDRKVTQEHAYTGSTLNWAKTRQHPTDDYCCVKAKNGIEPDEESSLQLVEELGEDWYPAED